MRAEAREANRARDDELVITLLVGKRREIEGLWSQELPVDSRDPAWGVAQVGLGGILSQRDQQVTDRMLCGTQIDAGARPHHAECAATLRVHVHSLRADLHHRHPSLRAIFPYPQRFDVTPFFFSILK